VRALVVRAQAVATAAVLASGIGLAAAGGATSTAVPQASGQILALIARSPEALAQYPSLRMTVTINIGTNGRNITLQEHGLVSRDGRLGTVSMALPNGLGQMNSVVSGRTIYVRIAPAHLTETGGRHWAGLTLSGGQTQPVSGSNALDYLRLLVGANGHISVLGHDTIDGAPCTHYRVDVDVAKALANAPVQVGDSGQQLLQAGIHTLPTDVWIDAQGRPRQMKMSYHLDGGSFATTIRFQGSSEPVHATLPLASDIFEVSDFQQLAPLILNTP